MKLTYRHTLGACYLGYITQAVVNTFPPLLFLTFYKQLGISMDKVSWLIIFNFGVQIITDLIAANYVDRIGYRRAVVFAQFCCVVGMVCLAILPFVLPSAFVGLLIAIGINAVGGGLLEVLVSPIVESLPGEEKASAMSLLHSFYCWGYVAVVLISTLFFAVLGTENWPILSLLWLLVPLGTAFLFLKVPMRVLVEKEKEIPKKTLFTSKIFWILFLLMVCAGASEQAMSQWASFFAEAGLGVSKELGDLLGPGMFALFMGLSRLAYGMLGAKIRLERALVAGGILCILSYLLAVFAPYPALSLLGCALCGFSVGIMWPGVFSLSAKKYPAGGTFMFGILALAGDVGCAVGPGVVGFVSDAVGKAKLTFSGDWFAQAADPVVVSIKTGLLFAIGFPILLLIGIVLVRQGKKAQSKA